MRNHSSKTTLDTNFSLTLSSNRHRTNLGKFGKSELANGDPTLTVWKCATCGRRYEGPTTLGPFITPPPTTECIIVQTEETFTHDKGGFVNLVITSGATCDYVRVNHVVGETDFSGQITKPEDPFSATKVPIEQAPPSRAHRTDLFQVEGRHGRVRKVSGAVKAAYDEEDSEDGEFWKTRCNDFDCIFKGNHCRDQCAMAEMDEGTEPKAPAPKRGLMFRR